MFLEKHSTDLYSSVTLSDTPVQLLVNINIDSANGCNFRLVDMVKTTCLTTNQISEWGRLLVANRKARLTHLSYGKEHLHMNNMLNHNQNLTQRT